MQREAGGPELKTGGKYYLLGPCYHLVRNVQVKEETPETKDLTGETMAETEPTEVRDIKKEKVNVLTSGKGMSVTFYIGAPAGEQDLEEYNQTA